MLLFLKLLPKRQGKCYETICHTKRDLVERQGESKMEAIVVRQLSKSFKVKVKEKGLKDVAFFPVMPFPGTEISKQVGKVVYQGAIIDDVNVYERSFASSRLKKYSARPEISLNEYFSSEQLRLLVKFAYTRFFFERPVIDLEREFHEYLINEEEGFYAV